MTKKMFGAPGEFGDDQRGGLVIDVEPAAGRQQVRFQTVSSATVC